jgi:hypothetical protein
MVQAFFTVVPRYYPQILHVLLPSVHSHTFSDNAVFLKQYTSLTVFFHLGSTVSNTVGTCSWERHCVTIQEAYCKIYGVCAKKSRGKPVVWWWSCGLCRHMDLWLGTVISEELTASIFNPKDFYWYLHFRGNLKSHIVVMFTVFCIDRTRYFWIRVDCWGWFVFNDV